MNEISNKESEKNYLKYKNELEYEILIENKNIVFENQREKLLRKKVFDQLYENKLISKDYYTTEIEKLYLKNKINYKNEFISIIFIFIMIIKTLYIMFMIHHNAIKFESINNTIKFDFDKL